MAWITLRTTCFRWEAELMQQVLAAHQISARIIDLGVMPYTGLGSPTALQVHSEDQWTALLLLSPVEEDSSSIEPED
ncbi:hypothetical protein K9N68_11745 [Kovacikia minuta CCNUW1]|uniref:hypothetical protein n=1 Tax=Kovacikia minuta TaxID=2931930 RepID=UPI001CCE6C59|nr:hypothetical protein [Kovacikia minuta]UBF28481.1 hypothetical protein K9N68_11745 [Kovacikia minuta CCNUW1]